MLCDVHFDAGIQSVLFAKLLIEDNVVKTSYQYRALHLGAKSNMVCMALWGAATVLGVVVQNSCCRSGPLHYVPVCKTTFH